MKLLTVTGRFLVIAFSLLVSLKMEAQILWNFDGGTGTASAVAASIPANITVSNVSKGNASLATPVPNFLGNSPVSSGYTGASGSYAATMTAVIGTAVANLYSSTYLEFTLTPATGYQINLNALQFGTRSTAQNAGQSGGPTSYHIRTSADNYGNGLMTNAGSLANGAITANSVWALMTPSFNNGVTSVTAGLNGAVTVRIYATQVVNNTGQAGANWRIDDLSVTATATVPTNTPFYYKGTGNITTLSNWGSSTDGTGASPASFYIPGSTYNIANTTGNVNLDANWFIGGKLNVGSGIFLNTAAFKLALGTSASAVFGPGAILNINNAAGIADFNGVPVTLQSDASGTASIGTILGTLSNATNVTVQKYVSGGGQSTDNPSKRAYRFWAHPFSTVVPLSQLTTTIDITGAGGGSFTATGSNAASAFYWDQSSANGNANDAGWKAFVSDAATNWGKWTGARIFYRGAKGQGLTSASYMVGSTTISMNGTLNTGDQTIPVTVSGDGLNNKAFNFIGNPYPSNVQMNGVTQSNTTGFFYVWNLGIGSRGGYSAIALPSSYTLPAYAGFFVEATATGNVIFHETDKTPNAATNELLRENKTNQLVLQLRSNNILWDELIIGQSKNNTATKEYGDATKLYNPDVSFYSLTNDNKALAIDTRNIQAGDIIPLGLLTNAARSFSLEVSNLSIPNIQLYLHDRYNHASEPLTAGTVYSFSTDANAASQGNNRFEILAKAVPMVVSSATGFNVKLSPNPATNQVTIGFTNETAMSTTIALVDAEGKTIQTINAGKVQTGQLNIPVKGLAKGNYYVVFNNGRETRTEKLQVQ